MPGPLPVEQSLVQYLAPSGHVGTRVPNPRPETFTRVTRTGGAGPRSLGQTDVTLLIECFADTDTDAWALAETVWRLMYAADQPDSLPLGVQVAQVVLSEPVNFPDTSTGLARYQFIAALVVNLTKE